MTEKIYFVFVIWVILLQEGVTQEENNCTFSNSDKVIPRDGKTETITQIQCERKCKDQKECKGFLHENEQCTIYTSVITTAEEQDYINFYLKRCFGTCQSGHEYKNGDCTECDIGFYKDEEGDVDCTKCPIHTTTSGRGSMSISSCNSTLCGPGQEYKNNNCSECNIGFYKEEEGNSDCTECPDHKTTSGQASTSRSSCNITFCGEGFFLKNISFCQACPNGTYKNFTGNFRCLKCPMNKTTIRVGSTHISNCSLDCAQICTKNDPCRFTGTSSCVCPSGYYGPKCTKRCSPGCFNDSCHRMNGTCPCKEGFYDEYCLKTGSLDQKNRWDCHCAKNNCSEQACLNYDRCSMGWFGESCKYRDLGVLANMGNEVLNDNNDSTCVKQNNVTIDWQHELQAVTWVRLVFTNNDHISDVEAVFFEDQSSEPFETCDHHYLKLHKTGNTTIDLHCVNSFFIRLLKVSWKSDSPLCSAYVSGGRNVAPGSRQVKWNIKDKKATSIGTLTDGNYDNKGCLMMNSDLTLQLFLWKSIFSSEIRLFTDFSREDGQGHFYIELFNQSSKPIFNMSSSGNDVFVQRAFFMDIITISFINIQVLSGTLHLCEVEIFGDCDSPHYGYSCLDVCYLTCLDQVCTYEGDCYQCTPGRTGIFCEDPTLDYTKDSFEADTKPNGDVMSTLENKSVMEKESPSNMSLKMYFMFCFLLIVLAFIYTKYYKEE